MNTGTFRLVSRSDFDSRVFTLLLKELGIINGTKFVHLKDMQNRNHRPQYYDEFALRRRGAFRI